MTACFHRISLFVPFFTSFVVGFLKTLFLCFVWIFQAGLFRPTVRVRVPLIVIIGEKKKKKKKKKLEEKKYDNSSK